ENRQGKGHMLKTMIENIDADIFIMIDGDGTYAAKDVHKLILPVIEGKCDMCIGNRLSDYHPDSFSYFHLLGNKLIRYLTYKLHGVEIPDMLTGYRVMSRKLIDDMFLISGGFEIETEINIKSVWLGSKICSVDIHYGARPAGSISKIKTLNDGYRILSTIFMLLREHQPMTMGGVLFLILSTIGAISFFGGLFGGNLFCFIFGLSLFLIGTIALATGIILNAINISHRELEQFHRKLFKN
ncbi:MAG TPA: glycosyltransferase, partial [Proteobacteria bacterium]|nr:glycosyltransferase [Pseudomonadota bacterium]